MSAERIVLAMLICGIAAGCVLVLYPFFSALLWAAILVFSTWPVAEWLRIHLRLGRAGAAWLMVGLIAVVLVLPLTLAAPGGGADINHLRTAAESALRGGLPNAPRWVFEIPIVGTQIGGLWDHWAADISALGESLRPYFGIVLEAGLNLFFGIAHSVVLFILALFIAFFFYLYGSPLAAELRLILRRVAGVQADHLILVTGATVRGVVYGILGTGIVQGILTAIGLWTTGVPRPVLLGVVAAFLAVLPIGAPLVWIPAGIWLLTSDHLTAGVFLLIYGVVVVSGADHLIRPWFISRGAHLPFLLTVLGVLGGVLAFGLLGIFLGPVLLSIGFTLVTEWARSPDPMNEPE